MAEVGTGLAALALAWGGKDLLVKMLGPSADYLGGEGQKFVEKSKENIGKNFQKNYKILGSKIDEPGGVPPRVLREIINQGAFCEDELTAEYFGGLLASSRSPDSKDDRVLPMLDMIKSLSTYQIRAHYVIYQILRKLFLDSNIKLLVDWPKYKTFIPAEVWFLSMRLGEKDEEDKKRYIVSHSLVGLANKGLIHEDYRMGDKPFLKSTEGSEKITSAGIVITPKALGVQLFLYVNGHINKSENHFIDSSLNIESIEEINIPEGSVALIN